MIRLGIVDCDTSHVVEFTKRLNHVDVAEDHWVNGAKIVAAVPGMSLIKPEVIPKYVEALKGYGVEILDKPEQLYGKIDAVLIESNSGMVHLERAMPFIERGIPTFVDKPFTCSLADAKTLFATAEMKHVPLMSCSSLRFVPEIVAAKGENDAVGKIIGAATLQRMPDYPDVPTVAAEPGMAGYELSNTYALYVPARTPVAIINGLNRAVAQALNDPELRKKMLADASTPATPRPAEDLKKILSSEIDRWEAVVKKANIKLEE